MAVAEGEQSTWQQLSQASERLAESMDYESTLMTVAETALPYLGSWCIVDIVEPGEVTRRVGIVHPDPVKQEHARRLESNWPAGGTSRLGVVRAYRTGETEVIPHVSDEMLVASAVSEENLGDLRALGIGSVVVVPLVARGNVIGAMTFVSSDLGHQYAAADLKLAEDLVARCALAIDNARLFRQAAEGRALAIQLNERLVVASMEQQELAEVAKEANRAKSQFLATFSHEIRTPINAIVGYTDLLELEVAGPMSEKQMEFLERIQSSSRHLIELIDDILDLAKVESGRLSLHQETLPTATSIAAAIALMEAQADVAGIRIRNDAADAPEFYRGDVDRVRQIILILLTNALKFTERGGTVTVSCGTVHSRVVETLLDGDGPWTFIRVEDTGIGISRAEASAVFEPFVQSDRTSTRTRGGAGLGLAIGLELARRMGGDLTLRSVIGKGSAFTLWLPVDPPVASGDAVPQV
jgi:signal transduction histidine kinase